MKKRILSLLVLAAMSFTLLAGCAPKTEEKPPVDGEKPAAKTKVTFWAEGSDNVKVAMQKVTDAFNASPYGEKYTMELQFLLTGTGGQGLRDRMIAEFKAGKKDTGFDVMETGIDQFAQYNAQAGEDFFMKIDTSKVPNFDAIQAKPAAGEGYAMPYRGTTVVLAYNSDVVKNPPKTADELTEWIKANPGRFAYNVPGTGGAGDSFARTAVYNRIADQSAFLSQDEKWIAEWDAGFKYLEEIHPFMYKAGGKVLYPNKNQGTLDLLANKEVDMIPAWADMTISQIKQGTLPAGIKISQIDPSFTGGLNAILIPKISTNVEGAYAVMDFFATPEVQNILLNDMAAIPLIDQSKLDPANAEMVKDLKIDEFRLQAIGTLDKTFNKRWEESISILK